MSSESQSAHLQVKINGKELKEQQGLPMWFYLCVKQDLSTPTSLILRFQAKNLSHEADVRPGSKVTVAGAPTASSEFKPLFSGTVVANEVCYDRQYDHWLEVRAHDQSYPLFGVPTFKTYLNKTVKDIVEEVVQRNSGAKITAGEIEDFPTFKGDDDSVVTQDCDDWKFIQQLADLVGASWEVDAEDTLHFRKRTPPSDAPAASDQSLTNALVLDPDTSRLFELRAVRTPLQAKKVKVRGWSATEKKMIEYEAEVSTKTASTFELDEADALGKADLTGTLTLPMPQADTADIVRTLATSYADRVAGGAAELEGVLAGHPDLKVNAPVRLKNTDDLVTGGYWLTTCIHEYTATHGYRTRFVASASDRSMYGVVHNGRTRANAVMEVYPGQVTEVAPDGKVKVMIAVKGDTYVVPARVVLPGAGKERGLYILPEVEDEVLVMLAGGVWGTAYVVGGLYNGKDTPPVVSPALTKATKDGGGDITGRYLYSRTGHMIGLVEATDDSKIVVQTADKKHMVTLDEKKNSVTVKSDGGKVVIEAKDLVLEATTVSIKASGGFKIE